MHILKHHNHTSLFLLGPRQWYDNSTQWNCNSLKEEKEGGFWHDPPLCEYRCYADTQHWVTALLAVPFGMAFVIVVLRLRGSDGKVEHLSSSFFGWGEDQRVGQKYHALAPIPENTTFVRAYFFKRRRCRHRNWMNSHITPST